MENETMYQYRSIDVFQKIIESKKLRLTSAYHQNDKKELKLLLDYIEEKIDILYNKDTKQTDIKRINKNIVIDYFLKTDVFISCFSKKGDKLSQWRAYGNDGRGISIGFNFNFKYHNLFYGKVCYDNESYIDNNKHSIDGIINDIYQDFSKAIIRESYYINIINTIKEASLLKHNGFIEEEESRIVFIPLGIKSMKHGTNINNIINNTYKSDINDYKNCTWTDEEHSDSYQEIGDLKFYATQDNLIPYFEFKYLEESIHEIILGPCCTIKEDELKYFLVHNGFDLDKITVSRSSIPYCS